VCRHRACTNDQRRSPPIALKAWLARALPGPGITSAKFSLGPTAPTESLLSRFDSGRLHHNPFFQQTYAVTVVSTGDTASPSSASRGSAESPT
jgi:hypothetical protein